MSQAPRERMVHVKSLSGTDVACGASVFVPLDKVQGAPLREPDGTWGHAQSLRMFVQGTWSSHTDAGGAMPGRLLADCVTNVKLRGGGVELIDGTPTGEDLNLLSYGMFRAMTHPPAADVPDAIAVDQAFSTYVDIPLSANRIDRWGHESDDSVPLAAFATDVDGNAGLSFRFAPAVAVAQGGSSFKGFGSVVLKTITACDVWMQYRAQEDLNIGLPGIRFYNEAQTQFSVAPIGGPFGATRFLSILDAPSTSTGARDHTVYSNISCRVGDAQLYSGRSWTDLVDMSLMGDFDPTLTTAWNYMSRTAPGALPLFSRRHGAPLSEDARGPITVNFTRSTSTTRLMQFGRQSYNTEAAHRIAAAVGGAEMFSGKEPAALTNKAGFAAVIDQKLKRLAGK